MKTSETLTYQEIESWSRLSNKKLKSWEVRAIKAIDAEFESSKTQLTKSP